MLLSYLALEYLQLDLSSSYFHLFRHVAWLAPLYASILFTAFYLTSEGFRKVTKRLWALGEPKFMALKRLLLGRRQEA